MTRTARLIGIERGGTRYYVFSDRVGSPRLVTDTSGATVKRINYDAFGEHHHRQRLRASPFGSASPAGSGIRPRDWS